MAVVADVRDSGLRKLTWDQFAADEAKYIGGEIIVDDDDNGTICGPFASITVTDEQVVIERAWTAWRNGADWRLGAEGDRASLTIDRSLASPRVHVNTEGTVSFYVRALGRIKIYPTGTGHKSLAREQVR